MIGKIDSVLSSIKSTWDSTIILTGDTNIDLLSSSTTRDMYKQMLHIYQLSCHITKSTMKRQGTRQNTYQKNSMPWGGWRDKEREKIHIKRASCREEDEETGNETIYIPKELHVVTRIKRQGRYKIHTKRASCRSMLLLIIVFATGVSEWTEGYMDTKSVGLFILNGSNYFT